MGDYGFLDFDNTEGFGPEHYIAQSAAVGQIYAAWVHLFYSDAPFVPVDFSLDAYFGSSMLWHQSGTLSEVKESSMHFNVTIPVDDLSCICNFEDGSLPARKLFPDYDCSCEFFPKYQWYCYIPLWGWLNCDDSDLRPIMKLKREIEEMEPTTENFMLFFNLLVAGWVTPEAETAYDFIAETIMEGKGTSECKRKYFLEILCNIDTCSIANDYILEVIHYYHKGEFAVELIKHAAPQVILKAINTYVWIEVYATVFKLGCHNAMVSVINGLMGKFNRTTC
jgi:hypothetical protein